MARVGVAGDGVVLGIQSRAIVQILVHHRGACPLHPVATVVSQAHNLRQHILGIDRCRGVVNGCRNGRAEGIQRESGEGTVYTQF